MIENERKYVLNLDDNAAFMKYLISEHGGVAYEYTQGYLTDNDRIRSIQPTGQYLFTFKMMVNGNLIEIEKDITKFTFDQLWTRVGKVITKTRIKVETKDHVWEVDFFKQKNKNGYYLVMAEVEMPPGQDHPTSIPSFISDHLLLAVARDDKRFANTQLSKVSKVKAILEGIKNGRL